MRLLSVTVSRTAKIRFCVQQIRTLIEISILISADILELLLVRVGFYIKCIEDCWKFPKILKMRLLMQRLVSVPTRMDPHLPISLAHCHKKENINTLVANDLGFVQR
jgi:hypothetical protein